MIITNLIGGLGNQMFQYAAGLALAKKHNVPLKIDVTQLNKNSNGAYTQRQLELNIFNLELSIATQNEINNFNQNLINKFLFRYFSIKSKNQIVNESGQTFNSTFMNLGPNTYLNGFWQNEKYFLNFNKEIYSAFNFKPELTNSFSNNISQLKSNSVSLHIRRGDYVTLSSANQFHGLCTIEYYTNALNYLQNKLNTELNIYIFSDDIDWCKKNLKFNNCNYLNTNSAAEDMYLMSNCTHNIIANSSFSWWGAWLNKNPNKIVIGPKYWFNSVESKQLGILPDSWIII